MKKIILSLGLIVWTILAVSQARAEPNVHYQDPNGFSFDYPASWLLDKPAEQTGQIRITPRRDPFFTVLLRYDQRPHVDKPMDADQFLNQVCLPIISHAKGVEILEKWKTKIGDKDAATVLYILPKSDERSMKTRYKAVVLMDGAIYYWFTFGGEDGSFERFSGSSETIVASFKLGAAKA